MRLDEKHLHIGDTLKPFERLVLFLLSRFLEAVWQSPPRISPPMKKLLIVDDSRTSRLLLRNIFASDPRFVVIGEAENGAEGVESALKKKPDVIIMDVAMPVMDGFEATRQIMAQMPTPIVIVTSSLSSREVETSMKALKSGAVLAMQKPPGPQAAEFEETSQTLRKMVYLMSEVSVARRYAFKDFKPLATAKHVKRHRIVAIASSTGGPGALHKVLSVLPADFPVPILIVQHIALGFAEGLARWLDSEVELHVCVAKHGEKMRPGVVYVAADDGHLGLSSRTTLAVDRISEPISGFRPSADFLFNAVATHYGGDTLAVILTGMGRDGASGLRDVANRDGFIIAQDELTSVVWSMPKAPVDDGIADAILPIQEIGAAIAQRVAKRPS